MYSFMIMWWENNAQVPGLVLNLIVKLSCWTEYIQAFLSSERGEWVVLYSWRRLFSFPQINWALMLCQQQG